MGVRVHGRRPALAVGFSLVTALPISAQLEFERPPIDYHARDSHDAVAELGRKIEAGAIELEYDAERGYLPSLLELLGISSSTQGLVFSKTSFQLRRISPERPRALYFNDDTYIGFVPGGDVIELSGVDPELGAVYYTLDQARAEQPSFVRDRGQCLVCHASSRTQGVPGHLVRSVFADVTGQPLLGSGTYTTDHRSPFVERWGGWYVTGTHGDMRHLGNVTTADRNAARDPDTETGANVTSLEDRIDTSPYLESTSDIVALMVLEHQTQMHNFFTLAAFETRSAIHHDGIMNEVLERPADHRSESTERRIAAVADKLVRYLFFVDEFPLTSPVAGVSAFTEEFAELGPEDSRGRSLRDFDLQQRLFHFRCSYLIYSEAFAALPGPVAEVVHQRIADVLAGGDPQIDHLDAEERTAIREILIETHPQLRAVLQS